MKDYQILVLFAIISVPFLLTSHVYGYSGVLDFSDPINFTNTNNQNSLPFTYTNGELSAVVKDDNALYMVWLEQTTDPQELRFVKSTDGVTISTPVTIDTVTVGFAYTYFDAELFVNDNILDVVFSEESGTSDRKHYHSRSTDYGTTWSTPVAIHSTNWYLPPVSSVSGNNIYFFGSYVTFDTQVGDGELYLIKSANGGTSWSSPIVVSDSSDTIDIDASSPSFGFNGSTIYVVYTALNSTASNVSFFSKSTNSGATWSTPVQIGNSFGELFVDENTPSTLAIQYFDNGVDDVYVIKSTDSGTTWSSPVLAIAETSCNGGNQYMQNAGSSLYLVCGHNFDTVFTKSDDFGATWSSPVTLQTLYDAPDGDDMNYHMTVIGNNLYILVKESDGNEPDITILESHDLGDTFESVYLAIQTPSGEDIDEFGLFNSGNVDSQFNLVYQTQGYQNIEIKSSIPKTSFGDPINISKTPTIESIWGRNQDREAPDMGRTSVFVDGDDLHFVYVDTNNGQAEEDLMYNFYDASTETMGTPVQIDTVTAGFGYEYWQNIIDVNGSTIDVFFTKETGGGGTAQDSFHTRSTNSGATWSTPVMVHSDTSHNKNMFVNGNEIVVFYEENFGGQEVASKRSTNGGTSWSSAVSVSGSTSSDGNGHIIFDVIKHNSTSYSLLFTTPDSPTSTDRLWYVYSDDSAQTWSTAVEVSDLAGNEEAFGGILIQDENNASHLVVIWFMNNSIGGIYDTRVTESFDGGATWGTSSSIFDDTNCGQDLSSQAERNHGVVNDGNNVYLSCIVDSDEVYFSSSTDAGITWSDSPSGRALALPSGQSADGNIINMEAKNDDVYITIQTQDGSFDNHFILLESHDAGVSFASQDLLPTRTDVVLTQERLQAFITDASDFINIVFQDSADTNPNDLFLLSSTGTVNTAPTITLSGANPQQINQGSPYSELGATCIDPEEGNISGNLVINSGGVNTSVIGSYTVFYDCDDSQSLSAIQKTRTVNVVDATSPTIALNGDNPMTILKGSTYLEASGTCTDPQEGDITGSLVIGGTVDTNTVGTYQKTYNCQDGSGNNAVQVIRTVKVVTQTTGGSGSGASVPTTPSTGAGSQPSVSDLTDEQIQDLLDQLEPTIQPTIVEQIVQTFFEFQVLDKTYNNVQIQSFLSNEQLGIRWSTGDDIIIASVVPAQSPFTFTFEQLPVIKEGSKSAISENGISYNLQVPNKECEVEFGFDCVEKIRYSVPVTVNAIINGTDVSATGTILVDLTEEELNPILILLFGLLAIPIIASIIWKTRGGHNPTKVKDLLK